MKLNCDTILWRKLTQNPISSMPLVRRIFFSDIINGEVATIAQKVYFISKHLCDFADATLEQ